MKRTLEKMEGRVKEYTLQYMLDYDWHRVTAVYDSLDAVMVHAAQLLADGRIVRLLARGRTDNKVWHTVRQGIISNNVVLNYPVPSCPE